MTENNKNELNNREIIEKGSKVLIKELGYDGFLRYIKLTKDLNVEDYLELQDKTFDVITTNDIHNKVKEDSEKDKIQNQENKIMTILDKKELEGFNKGFKEGREKVRVGVAKELIKMESDIEFIVEITKLSKGEIEKIKLQLKDNV